MKKLFIGILAVGFASNVFADFRSNETTITSIVVKSNNVEINTVATVPGCGTQKTWYLQNTHSNFNALYSGFLAANLAGKSVDIVSYSDYCSAVDIDWAFVTR